ncbi:MAG: autotransporter-associated beta strand protein, partial [Lentimonas sp.]
AFGSSYDKELTATNGGTIKATSVAIRIGDVTLQNGSRLTANGSDGTYGGCYIGQLAGGASPTVTVTGSGASQIDGTGNMTLVSTIFEVEDVTGNNAADLTVSLSLQNMTGISFTGNVQIDGAVTKTGAGTLTLSATNSYTGATTVSAGILSLGNGTNNTALNDAADMIVASGAMLNLNYTGTDTIDELSLGGALQTPGIWGASGSGATFINDSFFSGGGTLTVGTGPEPTAYQSWGVDNGLSDADALTTANPESDGLSNLLEFAFGTDPTVSNGSSIAYGSGVTPGLPLLVLETITSNNVDSRAVFARRKEWVAAGLTYTVQFSADLSEWVDSSETPTLLESGSGDIDAVYVDYPLIIQTTAGFEKAQFFRLSVSHD